MAAAQESSSPIFGVTIPDGYRQWEIIAPSQDENTGEIRVILGNSAAMKAYRDGTLPFPDGSVIAKLSWKRVPFSEFLGAFVPGAVTSIQFMVKDARRYASTGGVGIRPIHRPQARYRGIAQVVLPLPPGEREGA